MFGEYTKAVMTIVVSTIGALVTALGPGNQSLGDLTTQTWILTIVSILGSGGIVWFCENGPWHTYIKTVVGFLSAGFTSLVAAFDDGVVTQGEMLTALGAAIVATGFVFQMANAARIPRGSTTHSRV